MKKFHSSDGYVGYKSSLIPQTQEELLDLIERVEEYLEKGTCVDDALSILFDDVSDARRFIVVNSVLEPLCDMSYAADLAAHGNKAVQQRYIKAAEALRDLCEEYDHPNLLKEVPDYEKIQQAFPGFSYSLDPRQQGQSNSFAGMEKTL